MSATSFWRLAHERKVVWKIINHQMEEHMAKNYFFYKNTREHILITSCLYISIMSILFIAAIRFFINNKYDFYINILVSLFLGYIVSYFYYYLITYEKYKTIEQVELNAISYIISLVNKSIDEYGEKESINNINCIDDCISDEYASSEYIISNMKEIYNTLKKMNGISEKTYKISPYIEKEIDVFYHKCELSYPDICKSTWIEFKCGIFNLLKKYKDYDKIKIKIDEIIVKDEELLF